MRKNAYRVVADGEAHKDTEHCPSPVSISHLNRGCRNGSGVKANAAQMWSTVGSPEPTSIPGGCGGLPVISAPEGRDRGSPRTKASHIDELWV